MIDFEETIQMLRRRLECVTEAIAAMEAIPGKPKSRRGRKSMGSEERLVVSERMRQYWAGRRQARTG
jgi:hypothetical protein